MHKTLKLLGGILELQVPQVQSASQYLKLPDFVLWGGPWNHPTAEGLASLEQAILDHADKLSLRMQGEGGWLKVKAYGLEKPGKTLKCSLPVRYGEGEEVHQADFWVAKSLLHHETDGTTYCPAWAVEKELEKTQARSQGHLKKIQRTPADKTCWPPALRDAWVMQLLDQLPSPERLQEAVRAREEGLDAILTQAKAAREAAEKRRQEERAQAAEASAAAVAQKQKRRESMECRKSVSVRWTDWTRQRGRFVAEELEAEGADVYFSGERVYIVFPDGDELIKKRGNVTVLEPVDTQDSSLQEVRP